MPTEVDSDEFPKAVRWQTQYEVVFSSAFVSVLPCAVHVVLLESLRLTDVFQAYSNSSWFLNQGMKKALLTHFELPEDAPLFPWVLVSTSLFFIRLCE